MLFLFYFYAVFVVLLLESKNKIVCIYDIGYRVNIQILNPPPVVRYVLTNVWIGGMRLSLIQIPVV